MGKKEPRQEKNKIKYFFFFNIWWFVVLRIGIQEDSETKFKEKYAIVFILENV